MSFSQRSSNYIFFGCYLQEILVSGHLDDHPAPVDYGTVMGVVIYGSSLLGWQMSFSQRSSNYIFFGCYLQEILVSGHLDDHPVAILAQACWAPSYFCLR